MIIEIPDDEYEREEQRREDIRRKVVDEIVKNYQKILDEEKRGIHKTLAERMEEDYYNSLGVEDQYFYGEERRVRKFLEELKQQRPA